MLDGTKSTYFLHFEYSNRVSNKFGKILKRTFKNYFELIFSIKSQVKHEGWLVVNTYHPTGSKNLQGKMSTMKKRFT